MNTEINLQQGSDEWLAWRSSGLGSSDIPAILNISKYQKPFDLFEVKAKRKPDNFKTNPGIERGKNLEPIAREKFSNWYNLMFDADETFEPACLEMIDFPYMKTSLDGRSKDKTFNVEIKYQGARAHEAVKQGIINPAYYAQITHQMLVSGARKTYLCSINEYKDITSTLVYFDESVASDIAYQCKKFWKHVEENAWPTEHKYHNKCLTNEVTKHLAQIKKNDDELTLPELFEKWEHLGEEIKYLEEKKKSYQERIFSSGKDVCGDYRVQTVTRKGNVIYSKIPELKGVDLEQFRGADTCYKTIKKC